jgi:hypothetical protein
MKVVHRLPISHHRDFFIPAAFDANLPLDVSEA